jgi:hypothetical protein
MGCQHGISCECAGEADAREHAAFCQAGQIGTRQVPALAVVLSAAALFHGVGLL